MDVFNELFGTDVGGLFRVVNKGDKDALTLKAFKIPDGMSTDEQMKLYLLKTTLKEEDVITQKTKFPYIKNAWKLLNGSLDEYETPTSGVGADLWFKLKDHEGKVIAVLFVDHSKEAHESKSKDQLIYYSVKRLISKLYSDALAHEELSQELKTYRKQFKTVF